MSNEIRDRATAAANRHRWTWDHHLAEALERLIGRRPDDDRIWRPFDRHPAASIRSLADDQLAQAWDALGDAERSVIWAAGERQPEPSPRIAYFSPEFGLSDVIPQYSGGLGVLAGDHLKSADDISLPLGAVGLFYRFGFFRQAIEDGGQTESYPPIEPVEVGAHDTGITVEIPLAERTIRARVWRMDVGDVPMALLDTDVAGNSEHDRAITDRLYGGDRLHRLEQETVLGIGGARAIAALGWTPSVFHLNEGHAGFLLIELIDRAIAGGADFSDAVASTVDSVVFTTHTPVPAGIDRFEADLIGPFLAPWAERWNVEPGEVAALGAEAPDGRGGSTFNMAHFCLSGSGRTNGVSALHGEVSRKLFADHPAGAAIGSITNGVHARTWTSPFLVDAFDAIGGAGWSSGDPAAWASIAESDNPVLSEARRSGRANLLTMVEERTGHRLDPDALTFGFARRFATYKRATLLLRERERLDALIGDDEHPVQFIFAGKAHPADTEGKALMAELIALSADPVTRGRFIVVPGYDMSVARALCWGSDVWLNTPVRPHEASGTSGEKAALNGALNCSISDGWWDEMRDDRNGFTIASSDDPDPAARDDADAASAMDVIADEIVPQFYDDPADWAGRVRHVWRSLGPKVTAERMVRDYAAELYRLDRT